MKILIKNLLLFYFLGMVFLLIFLLPEYCQAQRNITDLAFEGKFEEIKKALKKDPALVNSVNWSDATALMAASGQGHFEIVKYLIENGADINYTPNGSNSGETALHKASEEGFAAIEKILIEKGADINMVDQNGDSPLHRAAGSGILEAVKVLVESGADVNKRDFSSGYSPLHKVICSQGYGDRKPLAINFKSSGGAKAADCMTYTRKNSDGSFSTEEIKLPAKISRTEVIKYLVKNGADINLRDNEGRTPLNLAEIILSYDTEQSNVKNVLAELGGISSKEEHNALELIKYIEEKDTLNAEKIINLYPYSLNIYKNNRPVIYFAVETSDTKTVELLIKKGVNVNALNYYDLGNEHLRFGTALHYAVITDKEEMFKILLSDRNTKLNISDSGGNTPLLIACGNSRDKMVSELILKGADVNAKNGMGKRAIHYCAELGMVNNVKLLIAKGADVSVKDDNEKTALYYAASKNHQDIVKLLEQSGAKTSINDQIKQVFTDAARGDAASVSTLVNKYPELLKSVDSEGKTLLHAAARSGAVQLCKLLLDKGVDIEVRDINGFTPIFDAVTRRNKKVISYLLSRGADINVSGAKGITPLFIAAAGGHAADGGYHTAYLLLMNGAGLNHKNDAGMTPLFVAAAAGSVKTIKLFGRKGADITVKDKNGLTAADIAKKQKHEDIYKILSDHKNFQEFSKLSTDEVYTAAFYGDTEEVKKIVDKYPEIINKRNSADGGTLLHIAAGTANLKLADYLVSKGADINASNRYGRIPAEVIADFPYCEGHNEIIKYFIDKGAKICEGKREGASRLYDMSLMNDVMTSAVRNGQKGLIEFLVNKGADVNTRDMEKMTLLHYAIIYGYKDIAVYLIEKGADINAKGMRDMTPLYVAAGSKLKDIVELLCSKGCELSIATTEGKTALKIAQESGYDEIADYLKTKGAR